MIEVNYSTDTSGHYVVVGGNGGIGKALVTMLLDCGATVHVVDPSDSKETHANLHNYPIDATDQEAISDLAMSMKSTVGSIDGLINLAGMIDTFTEVKNFKREDWERIFNVSYYSCLNTCQAFQSMLSNRGAIVNMSSGLAYGGQKNYGPYSSAKAAINSLTRTLANELAPKIRVNGVAPGAVRTPFIDPNGDGTTRFDLAMYQRMVPQGRVGEADEIAHTIMFLLSNAASHVTGCILDVNGGGLMR